MVLNTVVSDIIGAAPRAQHALKQPWHRRMIAAWLVFALLLPVSTSMAAATTAQQTSSPADKPLLQAPAESETPPPVTIADPSVTNAGTRAEVTALNQALETRRAALASTKERLRIAQARLEGLNAEFDELQQRLQTARLDLTRNYADLLRNRLARLQRQHLADNFVQSIKSQLEAAHIEQFRLEEVDAALPDHGMDSAVAQRRARLLSELSDAVSAHIKVLNEYFQVVVTVEERIHDYQALVQQRLFWLPSTDPVGLDYFSQLAGAATRLLSIDRWSGLLASVPVALISKPLTTGLLILLVLILTLTRKRVKQRLLASGEPVGNVSEDRAGHTLTALVCSIILALPGALLLALGAVLVSGEAEFNTALSSGFLHAGFVFLALNTVQQITRPGGLTERHFNWGGTTLRALRSGVQRLLVVLLPITLLKPLATGFLGQQDSESMARLLFTIGSLALSWFAHRVLGASLQNTLAVRTRRLLRPTYIFAVVTPLVLTGLAIYGYYDTAVQLERTLFFSGCWLGAVVLMYYLGLRALSVRQRQLTLQQLREQRAVEREQAMARQAAEDLGEDLSASLELPEIDLHAVSAQSQSLMRLAAGGLVVLGLWLLWSNVLPAFKVFDDITLWTIAAASQGGDATAITLGDLALALALIVTTILAARNLPGTLEVAVLSRMNLAPGTGYAISTMLSYIIVIGGVVAALAVIGAQWAKLQWLIAALGVGLGFGLQEIVANFVSGIIILFERPIRVGDTVTVGTTTGTVSRIRIRATTLVNWDRKEQIIPNKTFVTQDLTNWTLSDSVTRVIISVGVAYGSDVDQVRELLGDIAAANPRVSDVLPPTVFCVGLGDSSVNFEVRVFVKSVLDIMPLSHEMHAEILRCFSSAGIAIPFPQRDIHFHTPNNSNGGNPAGQPAEV